MALKKVKSDAKKNLADILIEKERLNESYDSSSAVSLKTLEQTAEGEETGEQAAEEMPKVTKEAVDDSARPERSMVNSETDHEKSPVSQEAIIRPLPDPLEVPAQEPAAVHTPVQAQVHTPVQIQPPVQPLAMTQAINSPVAQQPQGYYTQNTGEPARPAVPIQERKPWEESEEYNPPRRKRGRPYQGYAENTHVQSIYVRNDLYEYIMINYVGHGRKHTSFNKFVNAAINNYLRQLDENGR